MLIIIIPLNQILATKFGFDMDDWTNIFFIWMTTVCHSSIQACISTDWLYYCNLFTMFLILLRFRFLRIIRECKLYMDIYAVLLTFVFVQSSETSIVCHKFLNLLMFTICFGFFDLRLLLV